MSRFIRIVAPLCAALGLLAAAPAAPAQAALKSMWGPSTLPDGSSAFPLYKRLGVRVLQHQLSWRDVATARPRRPRDPADPAYRWPASLDQAVAEASRNGIRSALMVKRTPDWANGNRGEQWVPTHLRDYADFMMAAARHYRSVRLWMVWGEPTRGDSFKPMPPDAKRGPRVYAQLLDQAYGALKRVRRSNTVIGGMTWTVGVVSPPKFIRWMRLPNGKPPRLDWFGHNPFSVRYPRLSRSPYNRGVRDMSDVDTLYAEVRRAYRHRRTPRLWLSEFTVSARRANRAFTFFVSEHAQARWLRVAYRIACSKRYIAGLGWYTLLDEPADGGAGLTSGLLDASGRPKPAYAAYRDAC
jgi:hypothetical protein